MKPAVDRPASQDFSPSQVEDKEDAARMSNSNAAKIGAICHANVSKVSGELFCLTYGALVVELVQNLLGEHDSYEKVNDKLFEMGKDMGSRMVDELLALSNIRSCRSFSTTIEVVAKIGFKMFLGITPEVSTYAAFLQKQAQHQKKPVLPPAMVEKVQSKSIHLAAVSTSTTVSEEQPSSMKQLETEPPSQASAQVENDKASENQSLPQTGTDDVASVSYELQSVHITPDPQGMPMTASLLSNQEALQHHYVLAFNENPLEHFVELPEGAQDLSYSIVYCGAVVGALDSLSIKVDSNVLTDRLKGDEVTQISVKFIEVAEEAAGKDYKEE